MRFFFARERKHIHTTAKELTQTHTITGGGVRKREKERDGENRSLSFLNCVKVCERERVKNFVNKCESEEESGKEEHDEKKEKE